MRFQKEGKLIIKTVSYKPSHRETKISYSEKKFSYNFEFKEIHELIKIIEDVKNLLTSFIIGTPKK